MEDKIPDEQPNKLLPFLRRLADIISNDGDVDKTSDDILRSADLNKDEGVIQQLNNWIKVLQEYHINPDANQKEYLTRLIELGIPSASAELALAQMRETLSSDIEFELGRRNYVRAALLAQQNHFPQEKIHHFQELALRQFATDFNNLPGFQVLVKEWEIPQNEVKRILEQLLEETGSQWIKDALESGSRW